MPVAAVPTRRPGAGRWALRRVRTVVVAVPLLTGCTAAQIMADDATTRLQCAGLGAVATNLPEGEELGPDAIRRLADVATALEQVARRLPDGEVTGPARDQLSGAAAELRVAADQLAADPAAARAAATRAVATVRTGIEHTRTVLGC